MANQRVYQILVYRHELFKINFTGVPSSSSPVSPRFFPALSLAFFFARALPSERREQAREKYLVRAGQTRNSAMHENSGMGRSFLMSTLFESVELIDTKT